MQWHGFSTICCSRNDTNDPHYTVVQWKSRPLPFDYILYLRKGEWVGLGWEVGPICSKITTATISQGSNWKDISRRANFSLKIATKPFSQASNRKDINPRVIFIPKIPLNQYIIMMISGVSAGRIVFAVCWRYHFQTRTDDIQHDGVGHGDGDNAQRNQFHKYPMVMT